MLLLIIFELFADRGEFPMKNLVIRFMHNKKRLISFKNPSFFTTTKKIQPSIFVFPGIPVRFIMRGFELMEIHDTGNTVIRSVSFAQVVTDPL